MAYNEYLEDEVTVNVDVTTRINLGYDPVFKDLSREIQKIVNRLKNKSKTKIGRRVAKEAQSNQMRSINELNAICSGKLFGSIRITGRGGNYIIGTNSNDKGYYYLVLGRRSIDLTGTGRIMVFQNKCKGELIKTQQVGPAAPKDYMKLSEPKTRLKIDSIVQQEIANVMAW